MLAKGEILQNLRALDAKYRKATIDRDAQFAAKLAIIEACGWIEERVDKIVQRVAGRMVRSPAGERAIRDAVKKVSGFTYEEHIRKLLVTLVGWAGVEKVERALGSVERDRLSAALVQLKDVRNPNAHTFIRGTTPRLSAPSWTVQQFETARSGLQSLERALRRSVV